MSKTINVGRVTSYAEAVAGGYQGTREEWERDLANLGTTAAEVEANRQAVAEDKTAVERDVTTVGEYKDAAAQSAAAAAQSAESAHTDALAATAAKEAAQTAQGIAEEARADAVSAKGAAESAQTEANASASAAAGSALVAGNAAQTATNQAGAASDSATAAAASAASVSGVVQEVTAAKTEAISAIETKGAETLDSIPDDYTELSGDVDDLKSAVNYVGYIDPEQDLVHTLTPGYINGSGGINPQSSNVEVVTNEIALLPSHVYKITYEQPSTITSSPWCVYGKWTHLDMFTGRESLDPVMQDDAYRGELILSGSTTLFRADKIRLSYRSYESDEIKMSCFDITYQDNGILQTISNSIPAQGNYQYLGEQINLKQNTYLTHKLPFQPIIPSGETMQGIAVHNNILAQGLSSGKIQLVDIDTGTQIALHNANAGHCGSLTFSREFNDGNDYLPILYVSSYNEPKTFVYNVNGQNCDLIATYALPESSAGYCQETAIGDNHVLWCLGHKTNSYTSGGGLILSAWDTDQYTDVDGAREPTLLSTAELPWYPGLQSILYLNGQIFALFGSMSVADTIIRVIKPGRNDFCSTLADFPTYTAYDIKAAEPEGLGYGIDPDTGNYMLYMATQKNAFYLTIRFSG